MHAINDSCLPRAERSEGPTPAFCSSHTSRYISLAEPDSSQTLSFYHIFFSTFHLKSDKKVRMEETEETGGEGEEVRNGGGVSITPRKFAVDTRKQGKVTLLLEMVSCSHSCFSSERLAGFTRGCGLGH